MSEAAEREAHRQHDRDTVRCVVLTVSDTRTEATDRGGKLVSEKLEEAGHLVSDRRIVRDEPEQIARAAQAAIDDLGIDAVLLTGGTGISPRDQTPEAIAPLLLKPLPGYSELFRQLSFEEIGPAAMLSRAIGGVAQTPPAPATVVLTMPGSTAAVRLAMDRLIVPELGHLVREATK